MDSHEILLTYGRVSSFKQKDNFSIPTQLSMMNEECQKRGWQLYAELAEVGSAWKNGLRRSELQKALELAEEGKITSLMFFSPDRFTRDIGDGVTLRKQLREYGVKLYCFQPFQEITSDLEIVWILNDLASQKDIERRRESSMRGVEGKAREHIYPQGLVKYGYKLVGRQRDAHLEENEMEAPAVRNIFHWYYYENIGVTEIAKRLNEEGKYFPSEHNRRSGLWTPRNIRNILKSKSYTGTWYAFTNQRRTGRLVRFPEDERYAVEVPQLISPQLFAGVQEKLATRHNGRVSQNQYLLSHRVKCNCGKPDCGQTVHNKGHYQRYPYYRCTSGQYETGFCGRKKFPVTEVDQIVWEFALELLTNPELLRQGYRELQENQITEYENTRRVIAALDEQIAQQQEQLASIVDQRTTAKGRALQILLDQRAEEYSTVIDGLVERRDKLAGEIEGEDIRPEEMMEEIEAMRQMYTALYAIDADADFTAKRYLIDLLNLKATLRIDENGEMWVDIHWLRKTNSKLLTQKTRSGRLFGFLNPRVITFRRLLRRS